MVERTRDVRTRIVRAAAELLKSGGREAVSTRAVCAAAEVQAPTLYRHFGDMQGLLEAAAREVLAGYVRQKAKTVREPVDDPIEDLRRGWDHHVAFGLANPAAYALLYGSSAPEDDQAMRDGLDILHARVARVAEAGQLRVSVAHATRLIHAGGSGVTLSLIATRPEERDPRLSESMREAVLAAITVAPSPEESHGRGRVATRAVALRAVLAEAREVLSPAEQQLLGEWLDRMATAES